MTGKLKISTRSDVPPFRVMDVMDAAVRLQEAGRDIIHMEVGEPGLPTPRPVIDAANRALNAGRTGYTLALGTAALRARIARHYGEAHGIDLDPRRVIVTMGSSAAFILSFLACFDSGDRIAIARPGYPAYGRIMRALGNEAVEIPTTMADKFQPTVAHVDALENVQGLLVASPSNPTGTMVGRERLKGLLAACAEKGIRFISDEIYHRMIYEGEDATALAFTDDAIVINSFSKYYCMTGWRIGWMVVPEDLIRPVERLAQNLFIAPPIVSQDAALAAFDCTQELDARVAQYRANRDVLLKALAGAGVTFPPVEGAFYLYADVSRFTRDSSAFCTAMLEGPGVATVPGIDFDETDGHRYLRLCFSGAGAKMEEAARRLAAWLPSQSAG